LRPDGYFRCQACGTRLIGDKARDGSNAAGGLSTCRVCRTPFLASQHHICMQFRGICSSAGACGAPPADLCIRFQPPVPPSAPPRPRPAQRQPEAKYLVDLHDYDADITPIHHAVRPLCVLSLISTPISEDRAPPGPSRAPGCLRTLYIFADNPRSRST
jgi:hypothetical protein